MLREVCTVALVLASPAVGQGASLLVDIVPGVSGSGPAELVDLHGVALFRASDWFHGHELWRSDGTAVGTWMVADILPTWRSSYPSQLTVVGDEVFFTAGVGELWKSDGTAGGTVGLGSWPSVPRLLTAVGDRLFFVAGNAATGVELWCSDGTAGGTRLVRDLAPGPASSAPQELTAVGNRLYFSVVDSAYGRELWSSDGSAAGTMLALDLVPGPTGSDPKSITIMGGVMYFVASEFSTGVELYGWDGTPGGLTLFDLNPGSWNGSPQHLTVVGQQLVFAANDANAGVELWALDSAGPRVVGDLGPGRASSHPDQLTPFGSKALFGAAPLGDRELWVYDATLGLTTFVKDLTSTSSSNPAAGISLDSRSAVFTTTSGQVAMYVSNGTAGGTRCVLCPASNMPPHSPLLLNGKLLFVATTLTSGEELYIFDPGATVKTVGDAYASGFGLPSLSVSDPVLGQAFTASGDNAPASAAGAVLISSGISAPTGLPSGCWLWVNLAQVAVAPLGTVQPSWSLPLGTIPNQPVLQGLPLVLQAAFAPAPTALGFAASPGVYAVLGT